MIRDLFFLHFLVLYCSCWVLELRLRRDKIGGGDGKKVPTPHSHTWRHNIFIFFLPKNRRPLFSDADRSRHLLQHFISALKLLRTCRFPERWINRKMGGKESVATNVGIQERRGEKILISICWRRSRKYGIRQHVDINKMITQNQCILFTFGSTAFSWKYFWQQFCGKTLPATRMFLSHPAARPIRTSSSSVFGGASEEKCAFFPLVFFEKRYVRDWVT